MATQVESGLPLPRSPVRSPLRVLDEPSSPSPAWERLSLLEREETVLVMDRGNGRWVVLPSADAPLVRLLIVPRERLPESIRSQRDRLAAELGEAGLGGPAFRPAGSLRTLILKLTNACNYACTYCYDFETGEKRMRMEREVALAAVEQALDLAPDALQIIFHGGEPTLVFPLIQEIVLAGEEAAAQRGKQIDFTGQTNLSRLDRGMVDFSLAHRIGWGISMDGPPELNDQFRVLHGGQGTYHLFAKAHAEFPELVRQCAVLTTITAATDSALLEIARHFRDLGHPAWGWTLFQPVGRGRDALQGMDFSLDHLIASWNELFDAVEAGEFDGFGVMPVVEYLDNFLEGPKRSMCMRKECGAGRDLMSISADGTIEACDCIDRTGPLADLGRIAPRSPESLRRARQSDKAELIRSRDVELGKCQECIWLSVCGGTCLAHAPSLHGVWEAECALAMNVFDRISRSLAASDRLRTYRHTYYRPQ